MFYKNQKKQEKEFYIKFLTVVGSLSNLFSDSPTPYLYYRIAEKIFCRAFNAEDLSRSDVSVDAKKQSLGIGLKTFLLGNNKTFQKIAEFNRERKMYKNLKEKDLIYKIAQLRNERIKFTNNAHGIKDSIYHCVLRSKNKFLIYEEPLNLINIEKIRIIKKSESSIKFQDNNNEYSFLLSKSTLTKRFNTSPIEYNFDIKIIKDPLDNIMKIYNREELVFEDKKRIIDTIYLPLYGKNMEVFSKSGLNQWNAGGRTRHLDEIYIPVPANIHKNYPKFFPDRETPFMLRLPDGNSMKSKICQAGGKALMSYSNKELGRWILRDVLEIRPGELLKYEKLREVGIDSVRIDKINELNFEINFSSLGSYEKFANKE